MRDILHPTDYITPGAANRLDSSLTCSEDEGSTKEGKKKGAVNEIERVRRDGSEREKRREREREEKRMKDHRVGTWRRERERERKEGREGERRMKGWLVREGRHGVVIGCQCFPVLPTTQQPREIGIAYN